MEPGALIAVGVVFVLVAGLAAMAWTFGRSHTLIDRWAKDNGFRLLEREHRLLRRGPFWWRTSKGQTVYYVTVENADGRIRRGWVRCGGFFWGLWTDQVSVEWDVNEDRW